MKVGLIGAKLSHSFSKLIHEQLTDYQYDLIPLNEEELHQFMKEKKFDAINVTIPYKETVIPYCDEVSEQAKAIGAINAIKNVHGKLIGTNTDFEGLMETIKHNNIQIKEKHCLVLGTGGTSKTACAVLKAMNAKSILIAGRNHAEGIIPYEELINYQQVQVIINATSVGMYPNNHQQVVDCRTFTQLEAVADVIYNPLKTKLTQQAESLNIAHANGLEMLVTQAKIAAEFFLDKKIDDDKIMNIVKALQYDLSNLVLIGMPSSGKSTIAEHLAKRLNKKLVDFDLEIEKTYEMTIPTIFANEGEESFRDKEQSICIKFAKENAQILSCGGGIIKRSDNIEVLKQNGIFIHIKRDFDLLIADESRPLSKNLDALKLMASERLPIYEAIADIEIENNATIEEVVNKIEEAYHEIFNY